jgi:hypothetical protein
VLTIASAAGWLAVMCFFSFFVAPLVFSAVDRPTAARVVPMVLLRYYWFGAALSALALACAVVRGLRRHVAIATLCAMMLALIGYSLGWLVPAVEAARLANDQIAFVRTHRLSVALNLATMLAAALILVLEAVRGAAEGEPSVKNPK